MKLLVLGKPAIVGASILFSLSTHAALTAVDLDGNASNGHEGVYDDVLDITWLADANLAASNTFGVTGIFSGGNMIGAMNWATAEAFVSGMNADNGGTGYLGVDTWRQPTVESINGGTAFDTDTGETSDGSTDTGFQISAPVDATYNPNGQSPGFTGSELAYHYYNNFEAIGACYGFGTTQSGCQSRFVYGVDNAPDSNNNKALFSNIQNSVYWTGTELDSSYAFHFYTSEGMQLIGDNGFTGIVWAVADGNVGTVIPIPATMWLFGSALMGLSVLRQKCRKI